MTFKFGIVIFLLFQGLSLFSNEAFARKKPLRYSFEDKLKVQNKTVKQIEKLIKRLERKLGRENEKYLDILKAKKRLDIKIWKLSKQSIKQLKLLEKAYKENNKMMALNLVQNIEETSNASDLLVRKILMDELVRKKNNIKRLVGANKIVQTKIKVFQKRLKDYATTQRFVTQLLRDLEDQKSILARTYVSKIKRKGSQKQKRKKRLLSLKKLARNNQFFSSPLSSYQSIDFNKKGVSYKFLGRKPVVSTSAGVVVYSGKLSTYGNVVMIDHGKNTRSIILGQFKPTIKKGKKVKRDQVIGHTRDTLSRSKIAGKLYFEVRKKNKVQNTILLMDRKFLKKNNLINLKS